MKRYSLFSIAAVLLAAQSSAVDYVPPPDGLISRWPGDGDARDLQMANPGTLSGDVQFVPGKFGQAFGFQGAGKVSATTLNSLGTTGSATIDAWVQVPATPAAFQHVAGIASLLRLTVDNFGQLNALAMVNTGGGPGGLTTQTMFPAGTGFHHVAFVYDSRLGRGLLYLDGAQVAQTGPVAPGTPLVFSGQGGFTIGDLFGGGQGFVGAADEVEVFSRALTAQEIAAIFNAGSADRRKVTTIEIDIKPGSSPNAINRKSGGNVPVALLSSATFDALTVDRSTVEFASASPLDTGNNPEDVNGDGLLDVVFHFATQSLNLPDGATEACLTGRTAGGQAFKGCDSVRLVK